MRGLNVYCCPSCGHYGFFQLVANAVCPHCSIAMTPLPIPYQDFMDLDYPQRQVLISRHMLNAAIPSDSSKQSNELCVSPPVHTPDTDETAASLTKTSASSIELSDVSQAESAESCSELSKDSEKEALYQEVQSLREKNAQLEQTVSWMHDLIWELTRKLHITQNT